LAEHIARASAGQPVLDTELDPHETYVGLDPAETSRDAVTGHVAIQRGCDRFCTFCVVPFTRGRERAIPPAEVVRQVRALAALGYREVQLLGQTVNSYRADEGGQTVGFAELLRRVAAVDGIERIRFVSPYPLGFTAEVIAAMAELPKVCKHVHLPLQSASDTVLARMQRGYTFAQYRALVAELRAAMPDLAITTDFLVGFCGETEAEYAETLAALATLRFDNAFMFAYSVRAGTAAARDLPDDVPAEVKQRRLARVIDEQRSITAESYRSRVGRRERVLLESVSRRSRAELLGRTDGFRPVIMPAGPRVTVGALVDAIIDRSGPGTLYGHVSEEAS
jgi:tRNA-2-methylthio-N6-dimethylallyladenosine synthase